jgi:DNA-binding response OmpR family regulator
MDVLVVDDSMFSRSTVSHFLVEHEYHPIQCADGVEAWKALQSPQAPRVVVCDWVMPKLCGLDLCRHVRERHALPYIYFILLTSRTYKVDLGAAINAGVDDCLNKPCAEFELIARVNVGRRLTQQQDEFQDELRRSFNHSHQLLQQAPFAIACIDEHGKIVESNPAFAAMLGFASPDELRGQNLSSNRFNSPVDFIALLDQIKFAEPFHAVPVTLQRCDLQLITPRLWGRPITIEGRNLYHISTDFTLPQ